MVFLGDEAVLFAGNTAPSAWTNAELLPGALIQPARPRMLHITRIKTCKRFFMFASRNENGFLGKTCTPCVEKLIREPLINWIETRSGRYHGALCRASYLSNPLTEPKSYGAFTEKFVTKRNSGALCRYKDSKS